MFGTNEQIISKRRKQEVNHESTNVKVCHENKATEISQMALAGIMMIYILTIYYLYSFMSRYL